MINILAYKLFESNTQDVLGQELLNAAEKRDLEKVKELVKNGADVNYQESVDPGWNALMWAICLSNEEMAKFLIDNGTDVNALDFHKKEPAIFRTASYSNIAKDNIAKMLILKGANPNLVSDEDAEYFNYISDDMIEFFKKADIQKLLLDRYPETYSNFIKYNIPINSVIKNEYKHLETGNHLGLI